MPHDELALDHHFWRKISVDQSFQNWFLSRTKFAGRDMRLVTDELWHQIWYRDPETGKDSETDIFLVFVDRNSGERHAIHLENKPAHARWEINQAQNYRKRALNRMKVKRYVDFQVGLIAPTAFIFSWPEERSHFDFTITYEEIEQFIPEFAPPTKF
jgi:hypothetical protein